MGGDKLNIDEALRRALKSFYEETVRQLVEILNNQLKAKDEQLKNKDEQIRDLSSKIDYLEKSRARLEDRLDAKTEQLHYLFNEFRKMALKGVKSEEDSERVKKQQNSELEGVKVEIKEPHYPHKMRWEEEEERHIKEAEKIASEVEELTAEVLQEKLGVSHAQAHRLIELLKSKSPPKL